MYINYGVWIATICYVYSCFAYAVTNHPGQSLMMFGYVVANFGIIWSTS